MDEAIQVGKRKFRNSGLEWDVRTTQAKTTMTNRFMDVWTIEYESENSFPVIRRFDFDFMVLQSVELAVALVEGWIESGFNPLPPAYPVA